MTDTITILRCAPGLRLCKLVRTDGEIIGYDTAKHLDAAEVEVRDLDHLRRRLLRLMGESRCCVVRGGLIGRTHAERIRRLAYAKDDGPATMEERPHHWLALDMEGIDLPTGTHAANISACAEVAIATLPGSFHGARCIVQASASHGLKPGVRLRLWYWLDRKVSGPELRRWLSATPADAAVFRPVQPIYTASPLFEDAAQNPVTRRIADVPGAEAVRAPTASQLAPPPPKPMRPIPAASDDGAARYAAKALNNAVVRIATAPVNSRHETCVREARGLGRLVKASLLTEGQVTAALAGALEQAGKPGDEGALAAAWGIAHAAAAPLPVGIR